MKKIIGFYPPIRDQKDHADLLARATWYVWPWREKVGAIKLWSPPPPAALDAQALGFDAAIERQYADIAALIAAEPLPETDSQARQALVKTPCDLLFVWRAPRSRAERSDLSALRQAIEAAGGLVYVVDPANTQYEGSFYLWGCYNALGDQAAYIEECRAKFAALKRKPRRDRVYVFGTGPSLELAPQLDFSDGDAIVCNSIVGNEALLDQVKPFALVAGDPIFHAGCSQYAAEFREKLRHVLETRDIVFVTVMRDYVQHLAQLPPHLHDRVIALPFAPDKKSFRFDFDTDFQLSPEGNVLMLLLLPLAAALYDHITVCGCDGRPLDQNTYFWSHHKASQFSTDRMQNIQRVHPAFFERSYDDHYSEHIADVARVVDAIEDAGKRIDTLTPSYVPALAARQSWNVRQLVRPDAKPALLVSVNPDAADEYGHWLGYDRRLADEAKRRGVAFIALGNRKLTDALIKREGHLRRAFEYETWGAGNQPLESVSLTRMQEFEQSLRREVAAIRAEHPDRERIYYLYTGSLPHALAMYRIARDNPDDSFVVNTFWTSTMDCEAGGYMKKWAPFLRQAQAQSNLRILALTHQLGAIITTHTGVHLPLAPHPTPSMASPDAAPPPTRRGGAPTILFPGGMTEEKGFREIPGILCALRNTPSLADARLVVRATRTAGVLSKDATLRQIHAVAQTVDQVMDDAAFIGWLASADIAILPYRAQNWRYRNSALIVDLLYLGVPVVCSRGTWLADVIERCGGGITVDGDDAEAYARAAETIAADLEAHQAGARAAARRYHASNSWPLLVDSVFAPAFAPRTAIEPGAADKQAPLHYWLPGASPAVAASAQMTRAAEPLRSAPRVGARLMSFAGLQLLHSRRVQVLVFAAAACAGAALAPLDAVAPIRAHLIVLGVLALAGACASTLFRFLYEHAEAVRARIDGRSEALADLIGAFARALAGRGLAKTFMIGVAGLFVLTWASAYGLRLAGAASQFWLDLAFWGGGASAAFLIAGVLGAQTLLHGGKRIAERWRAHEALIQGERLRSAIRPALEQTKRSAAALEDTMRRQQALEITGRRVSRELEDFRALVAGFGEEVARSAVDVGARYDTVTAKLQSVEAALAEAEQVKAQRLNEIAALQAKMHEDNAAHAARVTALTENHERLLSMAATSQELAAAFEQSQQTLVEQSRAISAAVTSSEQIGEQRLEALTEMLTALGEKLAAVAAKQDDLPAKLGANSSRVIEDAKKALASSHESKAIADKVKQLGEDVRTLKTGGFQSFERHLDKHEQQELASVLSKSFQLSVTGHNLGYMAHQVRELEAGGLGRIAAPVSDVLVRTAALLAVERKDPAVLEIGTLFGLAAASMWKIARPRFERVSLTLIDPLEGYYGDDYLPNTNDVITGVPVVRATLEHNLRQSGVPDSDVEIIQHLSQSAEALEAVRGKSFDVLIIDGDHSYEGARRDFVNYAPLVRQGGFVIFDDYGVDIWQGVTDCANDIMARESNLERVLYHGRTLICRVTGPLAKEDAAERSSAAETQAASSAAAASA